MAVSEELKFRISLEDFFSKGIHGAEHAGQQFEHRIDSIAEHVNELKSEIIASLGIFQTFEFGKEAAQEFIESEKTARQLQFAVGMRGGLGSDFKELQEQAEQLQETGIFHHDSTERAAKDLLNYGLSLEQVKKGMGSIEDVAAASGNTLDEMVSAIGMAAAGGRAMKLKQFGLGFLALEKDMSVAGAEARNFEKIIDAMTGRFAGGNVSIATTTEFGKLEQFKNDMKVFREEIGHELMGIFDSALPSIKEFVRHMKEMFHWIKENANTLKNLAIAFGGTFLAMKTIGSGIAIIKGLAFAFGELKFAVQAWADAEIMASEAMAVTPWGAIAVGIGLLTFAFIEMAGAADRAAEAAKKIHKEEKDAGYEDERKKIEELADEYKDMSREAAMAKVMGAEQIRIGKLIVAEKRETSDINRLADLTGNTLDKNEKKTQAGYKETTSGAALYLSDLKKELAHQETVRKQLGMDEKGAPDSKELSEPKASKIQNITINMGGLFQNAKLDLPADLKQKPLDFLVELAEALTSTIVDSTVVASE